MHNSSFRWHDEIESKSRMVSGGGALPLPKIDHRNDRLNAKSENPKQNKHGHENNQPIEEQRDEPIEKMVGSIKYDTQSPWTWKESLPEDFEDSDDDGHDKSTGRRRRSRFPQIKSPTPSNSNSLANDETKDRMITYKAKPEYFLIRYSKVVRHIFSFLSFQDLDSAQSVCHHWYSSVMKEKMIRKTVESDSYAIRLKAAAVTNDAMSIDIEIEIRSFLRKIYVKPRYMIAFITWHSVTEIPEVLFQTLPRNCGTTIVASSQGLMGKKKNSKIDYHSSKGKVEGFVGIFIPKMERFSVLPFTTSAIENVRFTSSMLIKLGLKTENDQRLVKSIILFTSKLVRESTDNRAKPQKGAKSVESILEQMRKQMFSAIGHPIAFMGAPVNFVQHG